MSRTTYYRKERTMLETLKELRSLAARLNYDSYKSETVKTAKANCLLTITAAVHTCINAATKEEMAALVSKLVAENKEF